MKHFPQSLQLTPCFWPVHIPVLTCWLAVKRRKGASFCLLLVYSQNGNLRIFYWDAPPQNVGNNATRGPYVLQFTTSCNFCAHVGLFVISGGNCQNLAVISIIGLLDERTYWMWGGNMITLPPMWAQNKWWVCSYLANTSCGTAYFNNILF